MFGLNSFEADRNYHCGPGHRGRHRRGRHGWGGRHGRGDDGDEMRAGRMLGQGDLRFIMLALIAEQPRHGYEIIKLIEDETEGWYAPSPGIVYPTLTFLEETGYVTAQTEGVKKLYAITDAGRANLKDNRELVAAVRERLAAAGARYGRLRRMAEGSDGDRGAAQVPSLVHAALDNLRVVARERLDRDADAEVRIVEVLARAAADLRKTT